MKKLIPLALALGLMMPLAHAQAKKTEPAKEKPAAAETTKPEKKAKDATADKKKATPKTGEPSASDKELMADAKKEVDALTDAQRTQLLELLNKSDTKALEAVDGIGAVRAKNIMAKRPYAKAEDVAMVDGIGISTFKNLVATVNPAAKTEKPKTEKPKADEKKTEKAAKPETKPAVKEKPVAPTKKP